MGSAMDIDMAGAFARRIARPVLRLPILAANTRTAASRRQLLMRVCGSIAS